MRKVLNLFLAACVALTIASCANVDTQVPPPLETIRPFSSTSLQAMPTPDTIATEPFPGKIGIVTDSSNQNTFDFYSGINAIRKYGYEKIFHSTWSDIDRFDKEYSMLPLARFGEDSYFKVIVMSPTLQYASETISELRKKRSDIFYICIDPYDDPADIAQQTDMVLKLDWASMGPIMVQQAQEMGAKTFVHYSFPRHMSQIAMTARRDLIKQECGKFNIEFVDATIPDITSDIGVQGMQQFIFEDVPKLVAKYGKDTAFFMTPTQASSLINAVMDAGAIYIQQSDISPYYAFPEALGIEIFYHDGRQNMLIPHNELASQITSALVEKNMLGRVSSLPVDPGMMLVEVGAEYAIKRLNGEVQQEGIDVEVLKQLMEDYAGVEVYLTPYTDDETGETYDNYLLVRMDYITY